MNTARAPISRLNRFIRMNVATYWAIASVLAGSLWIVFKTVDSFWQAYLSNAFATLAGVLIGIPVALWIADIQERKTEAEKKDKILYLLFKELFLDYGQLVDWQKTKNKSIAALKILTFLRDDVWIVLSDSDELQWLKDPGLLSDISGAYTSVRMFRGLAEKYYNMINMPFESDSDLVRSVFEMMDGGIQVVIGDVNNTIEKIAAERTKIKGIG